MRGRLVNIVIKIEYDGERYSGSQLQENKPTIQAELEWAVYCLTGKKERVKLAGRTDAGVHAREQFGIFKTEKELELEEIVGGLNHYLDEDIAVKEACRMTEDFDVRRWAVRRRYSYYIINSSVRSPLRRHYAHLVREKLNIDAMNQACRMLVGEHCFVSFASDLRTEKQGTVKRVYEAGVFGKGDEVVFTIEANAFLPHQVRNTVGTLIRIGQGRMTLKEFEKIMDAKTPGSAGPSAPAKGLVLERVEYNNSFIRSISENLQR